MSKVITDVTGSVVIPADNIVLEWDGIDESTVKEVKYPDELIVITVTDMDGDLHVYTAYDGFDILVKTGDIVHKGAVLAELDV